MGKDASILNLSNKQTSKSCCARIEKFVISTTYLPHISRFRDLFCSFVKWPLCSNTLLWTCVLKFFCLSDQETWAFSQRFILTSTSNTALFKLTRCLLQSHWRTLFWKKSIFWVWKIVFNNKMSLVKKYFLFVNYLNDYTFCTSEGQFLARVKVKGVSEDWKN